MDMYIYFLECLLICVQFLMMYTYVYLVRFLVEYTHNICVSIWTRVHNTLNLRIARTGGVIWGGMGGISAHATHHPLRLPKINKTPRSEIPLMPPPLRLDVQVRDSVHATPFLRLPTLGAVIPFDIGLCSKHLFPECSKFSFSELYHIYIYIYI